MSLKTGLFYILRKEIAENQLLLTKKEQNLFLSTIRNFNTPWWSEDCIISSKQNSEAVYDFNGKEIIPYAEKIRFQGRTDSLVLKDKKWFLYDLKGKQLSNREFREDYSLYEGRALIINEDNEKKSLEITERLCINFQNKW